MTRTFGVTVGIGHPNETVLLDVDTIIDTGATHSMIPGSILNELGIEPYEQRLIEFADGRRETRTIGKMRVVHEGKEWECPVFFGPEGQYLLGATTLELFGLVVDPNGKRLVPVEYLARPF